MIKKFLQFIFETFNTKNYVWIKSNILYRTIATFKYNYEYFIHFDEFCDNSYNLYFYRKDGEYLITDLIGDNSDLSFKILSTVKYCTEDFINKNNVEFLGFSSTDKERDDLYTLFLQNLKTPNLKTLMKQMKNKKYYFLYNKNLNVLVLDFCILKFTKEDENIKK